jgi:UDP-N-acetyl-D-galactosamine dehydrogenase
MFQKFLNTLLAVAHPEFAESGAARIHGLGKPGRVLYDVKSMLPNGETDGRL